MGAIASFIRLGRPLFLGGGFLMYGLGAAIAAWSGHSVDLSVYAQGQLVVTAFQLMTHYANDYFDYETDRANATPTSWSGGSRVLATDELPRRVALIAALVLAAIGIGATVVLARGGPPWSAPIALAMGALAWAYSAPPVRLCATAMGELDTAVVVTGLVPLLGFYLQAPDLIGLRMLVLALAPLVLLQLAMSIAIEFPDAAGDAATGKHTLVVQLGAARGARLYLALTLGAYAWLPVAGVLGLPWPVVVAAALPAPLAVWRIVRIADHREPAAFERLTFFAVLLLVVTAACELAAICWLD